MTVDDRFTVYLNGRELGSHANWSTGRGFPGLGSLLRPGANVIAVRGENAHGPRGANPAGLACGLAIRFMDGSTTSVRSDGTWKCSREGSSGWQERGFDDRDWSSARVLAHFGEGPWGNKVSAGDEFEEPYTAGIPGDLRIIYAPLARPVLVRHLETGRAYSAKSFNPVSGELSELGPARADAAGTWTASPPPGIDTDWVLIIRP